MSSLRRDLIERRLWPLAVVLIAAIVAVPFLLAGHGHKKTASLADAAPVPAGAQTTATAGTSAAAATAAKSHRTSGAASSRDPFAASGPAATTTTSSTPAAVSDAGGSTTPTASQSAPAAASTTASTSSAPAATGGSSSAGSGASATTVTTTTTMTTPAPSHHAATAGRWTVYSADVRYTAPSAKRSSTLGEIARYTALPAANWPRVMFMGLTSDGRDAVFALGAGVTAKGKATCHPSHDACTLISLRAGATEKVSWPFHVVGRRTMTLTVTRITKHVITNRNDAVAAIGRHSQIGLCELQIGDPIQYQYRSDGQLKPVSNSEPACTRAMKKVAVAFPGTTQEYGEVAVPGATAQSGQVTLPDLNTEDGR